MGPEPETPTGRPSRRRSARLNGTSAGSTAAAAGAGAVVCAATLALAPPVVWAAYTALYAGSAISRTIATYRTEVSASWSSPSAPPIETPMPGEGGG